MSSPSGTPSSHNPSRKQTPTRPPAVHVDRSADLLAPSSAALPMSPTATLGDAAVPHNPAGAHSAVTFTAASLADGASGISSAIQYEPPQLGDTASLQSHYDPASHCRQDLVELYRELVLLIDGLSPEVQELWHRVFHQTVDLDAMLEYFAGLELRPRSELSGVSAWQFFVRETAHEVADIDATSQSVLLFLVTRTSTLLRRAWRDVVAPFLAQAHPNTRSRRPLASLNIPSPNLRVEGFNPSVAPSTNLTADPASPHASSFASSSFEAHGTGDFYTHFNRGIASLDLPLSTDSHDRYSFGASAGHQGGTLSDDGSASSTRAMIRISEDSLMSGVADLDREIDVLEAAEESDLVHGVKARMLGLRDRWQSMLKLGGSVRSASPSPAATPAPEGSRSRRGRQNPAPQNPAPQNPAPQNPTPHSQARPGASAETLATHHSIVPPSASTVPPSASTVPPPLAPSTVPPPQAPSTVPSSPAPWDIPPGARPPPGTTVIHRSRSGIYRITQIITATRSPAAVSQLTVPPFSSSSSVSENHPVPVPAPAIQLERAPEPSPIAIPPFALSPDADIAQLLRLSGSDEEIVNPNHWASLFDRVVGRCVFSALRETDPSAPSTSTSRLEVEIGCINTRHRDMGLPCTLPIPIAFDIVLGTLLRQLEVSQGTRVSQLMSIVARAFLNHHQGSSSTDTLVPAAQASSSGTQGVAAPVGEDRRGKGREPIRRDDVEEQ